MEDFPFLISSVFFVMNLVSTIVIENYLEFKTGAFLDLSLITLTWKNGLKKNCVWGTGRIDPLMCKMKLWKSLRGKISTFRAYLVTNLKAFLTSTTTYYITYRRKRKNCALALSLVYISNMFFVFLPRNVWGLQIGAVSVSQISKH